MCGCKPRELGPGQGGLKLSLTGLQALGSWVGGVAPWSASHSHPFWWLETRQLPSDLGHSWVSLAWLSRQTLNVLCWSSTMKIGSLINYFCCISTPISPPSGVEIYSLVLFCLFQKGDLICYCGAESPCFEINGNFSGRLKLFTWLPKPAADRETVSLQRRSSSVKAHRCVYMCSFSS